MTKKKEEYRDPLAFDPDDFGKEEEEIIPEGEQLFTIYNMFFGKMQMNPKGAKRSTDFRVSIYLKFTHVKSGLLLSRLNNGQDAPWNATVNLQRIGNIDTRPMYRTFMKAINAPVHKDGKIESFHIMRPHPKNSSQMVRTFTPFDDSKSPGPLGLPVKLFVIHKEMPVMKLKAGAEKNQWGRYNSDQLEEVVEDRKVITKIQEFIQCTDPNPEILKQNEFRAKVESGWPITYSLTEKEKKVRGEYFSAKDNIPIDESDATNQEQPEDIKW